jgi:uncharacterized membrane protein YsdA (DUF1294 family)
MHFILLVFLLITPGLALARLSESFDAFLMIASAVLVSAIAYVVYWWDKHSAQTGGGRVAETTLHLLELIGGWPGAFFAQRRLRHKSSKVSFLVVFWLIVAVHQLLAIDFLLDWRISRTLAAAVGRGRPQ